MEMVQLEGTYKGPSPAASMGIPSVLHLSGFFFFFEEKKSFLNLASSVLHTHLGACSLIDVGFVTELF